VVGLIGMRQTGKSTLARDYSATVTGPVAMFDLEHPRDLERLADPMLALEPLRGLVVIDEVQHHPDLFPVLRVLADRPRTPARFLVLGSASPEMLQQSSESLAGRISYLEVGGFALGEIEPDRRARLWLRGGLPLSFLARSDAASRHWRDDFVGTFLGRDVPQLGVSTPPATLR
jgi:predicted AAA+ superfamily ATPase